MREFELMLVIDSLSDDLEERVVERFDAFVGGHERTTLLTVTSPESPESPESRDALSAGRRTVQLLEAIGVRVRRFYPDLVTRKAISTRAGVTTQAVGLWIRGERFSESPFPEPYTLAGGGLWMWSEVNDWLRERDLRHDDLQFPSRAEVDALNVWLACESQWASRSVGSASLVGALVRSHRSTVTFDLQGEWRQSNGLRVDFALVS